MRDHIFAVPNLGRYVGDIVPPRHTGQCVGVKALVDYVHFVLEDPNLDGEDVFKLSWINVTSNWAALVPSTLPRGQGPDQNAADAENRIKNDKDGLTMETGNVVPLDANFNGALFTRDGVSETTGLNQASVVPLGATVIDVQGSD